MAETSELLPRERKLLISFISPATVWFRAASFTVLVLLFAAFTQLMIHWLLKDLHTAYQPIILALLTLGFAAFLYRKSSKLTGGRKFRAKIKQDLEEGHVNVERFEVSEAIEVEAKKNEAPAFFLKLSTGKVMFIQGRENLLWKYKGFPWKAFAIRTAPNSGRYLGLQKLDESLKGKSVCKRPPLTIHEHVELPNETGCHVIEGDFENLKTPQKL